MSEHVAELGPRLRLVERDTKVYETPQDICPNLLELAHYFRTEGERVFSSFMWDYVGHPDALQRMAGQQPVLERRGIVLDRELFSGFSAEGTLLHVRTTQDWPDNERKFLVAVSRFGRPMDEAKLLSSHRKVYADKKNDTTTITTDIRMMEGVIGRNWPPLMRPGKRDQWRLSVEHAPNDTQVTISFGMQGEQEFYPLDQLTQALEVLRQTPVRTLGHLSFVHSDIHRTNVSQLLV